jgi:hypothetical protein
MATEIVTLPILGTLTAKEWHLFAVFFLLCFVIAVSPLRSALRSDWWYAFGGAVSGAIVGFVAAYVVGWL